MKPFTADNLVTRVDSALQRTRDRREALNARERMLAELRDVVKQAPVSVAVLRGPLHVFEIANQRYLEMTGRTPDILGKPVRTVFPEAEAGIAILDAVYRSGDPYMDSEIVIPFDFDGDGVPEDHYMSFNCQPLKADGETYGLAVVAIDLTDQVLARKRAEVFAAALESRTAQFETLVNKAPLGVYLIDQDFRIVQVNPIALPEFGEVSDLIGRDFDEVIHILWTTSTRTRSFDCSVTRRTRASPTSRRSARNFELTGRRPSTTSGGSTAFCCRAVSTASCVTSETSPVWSRRASMRRQHESRLRRPISRRASFWRP